MFKGSIPALVTPFKGEAVDFDAFESLVERQISAGAGGLVPCGTTGESATLSHREHRLVVERCVEIARGRVPVIAGCGSNATAESLELLDHAKRVGADAALTVCPYYNRPDQDGLYAHFKALNDGVAIPLFLYNVPSRTSSDLLPDTVAKLSQLPNIIGIKDATGDMGRMTRHLNECADGFVFLSGDDPSAIAFNAHGGHGCISVSANIAPELTVALQVACETGDFEQARQIESKLYPLHSALFSSPSPGPAKYALSRMGLCEPDIRLPLLQPSESARARIDEALKLAGAVR